MSSQPSPRYPEISAAILAGGMARRLGGESKAFLPVAGKSLLDRQLDLLRPRFAEIIVVLAAESRPESPALPGSAADLSRSGSECAPYAARGLTTVRDAVKDAGPLAGLQAALTACGTEWLFTVACDMPFLDPRMLDGMSSMVSGGSMTRRIGELDALVPSHGGRIEPLHALYRAELAPVAGACVSSGRRAMVNLMDSCRTRFLEESDLPGMTESRSWTNLNTPEDLVAARIELEDRS
jgi:molybdopterin-guanine dinucleotide biosynthesis protein A